MHLREPTAVTSLRLRIGWPASTAAAVAAAAPQYKAPRTPSPSQRQHLPPSASAPCERPANGSRPTSRRPTWPRPWQGQSAGTAVRSPWTRSCRCARNTRASWSPRQTAETSERRSWHTQPSGGPTCTGPRPPAPPRRPGTVRTKAASPHASRWEVPWGCRCWRRSSTSFWELRVLCCWFILSIKREKPFQFFFIDQAPPALPIKENWFLIKKWPIYGVEMSPLD